MFEKIIIAPSANEAELLRTLAVFNINSLGLRVMDGVKFAEYSLMRSGIAVTEKYADSSIQSALIYNIISAIPQFMSSSFVDAQNISATLNTARSLILENESEILHNNLSNGEFPDNSAALIAVYDKYIDSLFSEKLIDGIQLIRRAAENAVTLNADVIILEEFPLTPAELYLIKKLSNGNYRKMHIYELFGSSEKTFDNMKITAAYGEMNEIEYIISHIYENGLSLDKCTIAVTDTAKYPRLISEIANQYKVPVTFGCGLPISNAYPAQLLRYYYDWKNIGYCGADALNKMIFSICFDRNILLETLGIENDSDLKELIQTAGNLRISDDKLTNQQRIGDYKKAYPEQSGMVELLRKFADEFEHGCIYFVKRYAYIRKNDCGKIDRSALNVIDHEISSYMRFFSGSPTEIIPDILSRNVLSENSREGHLHICDLSQAICSLRKNIFIVGLSASNFPGSPAENYLIPDNDLLLFSKDAPTSEKIISEKKENLFALLRFASAMETKVHLSYSEFSIAELKNENASSVLYEIYSQCHGNIADMNKFNDSINHIGYFESNISPTRFVGKAYNRGVNLDIQKVFASFDKPVMDNDITISPSKVEVYLKCQKKFYYKHIMNIQILETDDVFTLIPPVDQGNLIHDLMKYAADNMPDENEFYAKAERTFDLYIISRPPLNKPELNKVKNNFLHMAKVGYSFIKRNEIIGSEMEIGPVEISGIKLCGRLDILVKNSEGKYCIADFKTGRRITHKEDDFDSCIQILLYAYMLNKSENIIIDSGEYNYLRYDKQIKCTISNGVFEQINELLNTLNKSLLTGEYSSTEKRTDCQYCEYFDICRKEELKYD